MTSVYDKVIANQPICNILLEVIATDYYNHLFFLFKSGWVGIFEIIETYFSSYKQNWDCSMLNLEEVNTKILPEKLR